MAHIDDASVEFSPVRGDAFFRLQRTIGLIPARGLGVPRRVVLAVLLTWVPLVVAAAIANRFWPGAIDEPLMHHFGVHVRFLVAVPLFIIDDAVAHGVFAEIMPYFLRSGIVTTRDRARFADIVRWTAAWRDGWRPWVVIAGLVVTWSVASPTVWDAHELNWTVSDPPTAALRFAVFWYRYVAVPIYEMLLLVWLWRLLLASVLMWRVSRLPLALVPTHPDKAGGLGFLEFVPLAFVAPAFAMSAVLSGRWAHDAVYHAVALKSLIVPLIAFVVFTALALLVPLLVFTKPLWACRSRALFDYSTLVGEHHRRLRRRWILDEALRDDPMLAASELGSAGDSLRLYEAVRAMWPLPVSKRMLLLVVLLIALPMVPFIAVEVHLGNALMKIIQTLL